MKMYNLASSSSGNSTLICSNQTKLLVDVGLSGKALKQSLETIGCEMEDLDGILITHEHSDHIRGLGVISRKYGLPIYATEGTIREIQLRASTGVIPDILFRSIRSCEDFEIKDIRISPFEIAHDAAEPIGLRFACEGKSLGILTDLGSYHHEIIHKLQGLDAILLESNHDVHMLQVGSYPFELKRRILGDYGHLSNEAAVRLMKELWHKDLKSIVLGHLSKENNLPELALETMKNGLFAFGDADEEHLSIKVAPVSEIMETRV